jgi:glucose/arabinose dehydrogenase
VSIFRRLSNAAIGQKDRFRMDTDCFIRGCFLLSRVAFPSSLLLPQPPTGTTALGPEKMKAWCSHLKMVIPRLVGISSKYQGVIAVNFNRARRMSTGNILRIALFFLALLAAGIAFVWHDFVGKRERNLPSLAPAALREGIPNADHAVLATGLEIPWSLDFLPDGRILVTERVGRVRLLNQQEGLAPEALLVEEEVRHQGEGGLLGLAVHPEFADNRLIYLYYTYESEQGLANKVVSFTMGNQALSRPRTILEGIPGARTHNGGRIRFGPDGLLYITTGDAESPESAQNRDSLAGKILRVRDDGAIPADNPFPDSPVYSYGHRNPQGLAWDDAGSLWATEHGPRGHDEINLIEPGKNYGWPTIQGDEQAPAMEPPVLHSGTDTWAPSGSDVLGGAMYFGGLRGRALYEFNLDRENPALVPRLEGAFGRLRDVVAGPGGLLYILTSNRDGRGIPSAGDDLLLVVDPGRF